MPMRLRRGVKFHTRDSQPATTQLDACQRRCAAPSRVAPPRHHAAPAWAARFAARDGDLTGSACGASPSKAQLNKRRHLAAPHHGANSRPRRRSAAATPSPPPTARELQRRAPSKALARAVRPRQVVWLRVAVDDLDGRVPRPLPLRRARPRVWLRPSAGPAELRVQLHRRAPERPARARRRPAAGGLREEWQAVAGAVAKRLGAAPAAVGGHLQPGQRLRDARLLPLGPRAPDRAERHRHDMGAVRRLPAAARRRQEGHARRQPDAAVSFAPVARRRARRGA